MALVRDRGKAEPRPTPAPRRRRPPTPSFTRPPVEKPFQQQQAQARAQTRRAVRRLPAPTVAAPPVIRNPTPRQVHAAKRQIVQSLNKQLGSSSGAERNRRRDELLAQIAHDPRLAGARKSIAHYSRAEQALNTPESELRNLQDRVSTIPQRKARIGVGPLAATVNFTGLSRGASHLIAAATPGLQQGDAVGQFARNALKDVGTLAYGPFVGGYSAAQANIRDTVRLLGGDTGAILHGDTARIAKGIAKSYVDQVKHPEKSIREHPVLSALNLAGVESVLGRTAGAGARGLGTTAESAGARGSLARAGSTVRSPIALSHDLAGGVAERTASKSLSRKRVQVASDATRTPLRDANDNEVTVRQRGRDVPVLQPRTPLERAHLNKKRADMLASRANLAERLNRDKASRDFRVKGVPHAARDIVSMVTDGTITSAAHFQTDLANHLRRIRSNLAQHDLDVAAGRPSSIYLDPKEVKDARKRANLAERVLRSPRATTQAENIVRAGETHGRRLVQGDTRSAAVGLGDAGQLHRARLVHTAVEHMGARHGRDPRLDARIKQIKGVERSLQARLNFGHHAPGDKPLLQKQLDTARRLREDVTRRNTERLRDRHGNPLEPHHIEAFLRSRGRDPDTVAYLPTNVTRGHFHTEFRPGTRGNLDKGQRRTGAQQLKGSTEASAELLRAAGVRQAVALTKAQQLDRLVGEHGMRHPAAGKAARGEPLTKDEQGVVARGGYYNRAEAREIIKRAGASGERLVAVSAYPAKLDAETQRIIREDLQGPGAMDGLGKRLLNDRVLTTDQLRSASKSRNVVLMNADLVGRLEKHLAPSGSIAKFFHVVNRAFRYSVLPQPKWLAGEFVEPYIVRLTAAGSGINVFGLAIDLRATSRAIKTMRRSKDPRIRAAADEIEAQHFGGLLIGNRGAGIHRGLEDFPALNETAQAAYGKIVAKLPATRTLGDLSVKLLRGGARAVLAPLDWVLKAGGAIERGAQRAAFGRNFRRDLQEFTGSYLETIRLGQKAVEEATRGFVNTPTQHRLLSAQHELLGKYEGYSPGLRGAIQSVVPFIPWSLNAARFVMWTMPAHHSALTSLLTQVNNVVAQDWKDQHADLPPGTGLMIPNGKGGFIDLARFTPYGLTGPVAQGETRGVTSQFVPQFGGAEAAIEGRDPFGRSLQVQSGANPVPLGQRAGIAGNQLAEALIPWLSTIRRAREHGETPYSDSNVIHPKTKPGTSHGMSAAERVLYPFRPTYFGSTPPTAPSGAATSGSGLPASVQRALHNEALQQSGAGRIPDSVQRALRAIR